MKACCVITSTNFVKRDIKQIDARQAHGYEARLFALNYITTPKTHSIVIICYHDTAEFIKETKTLNTISLTSQLQHQSLVN